MTGETKKHEQAGSVREGSTPPRESFQLFDYESLGNWAVKSANARNVIVVVDSSGSRCAGGTARARADTIVGDGHIDQQKIPRDHIGSALLRYSSVAAIAPLSPSAAATSAARQPVLNEVLRRGVDTVPAWPSRTSVATVAAVAAHGAVVGDGRVRQRPGVLARVKAASLSEAAIAAIAARAARSTAAALGWGFLRGFSKGGDTLITFAEDRVRVQKVPRAVACEAKHLLLKAEVETGMALDLNTPRLLEDSERAQRRQQLEEAEKAQKK
jgi:hypothetical protein